MSQNSTEKSPNFSTSLPAGDCDVVPNSESKSNSCDDKKKDEDMIVVSDPPTTTSKTETRARSSSASSITLGLDHPSSIQSLKLPKKEGETLATGTPVKETQPSPTTPQTAVMKKPAKPPQRQTARQRTPVVRIQHQYTEMYDPMNNMGSSKKRKTNTEATSTTTNNNPSPSTSTGLDPRSPSSKRPKKNKLSPKHCTKTTANKKKQSQSMDVDEYPSTKHIDNHSNSSSNQENTESSNITLSQKKRDSSSFTKTTKSKTTTKVGPASRSSSVNSSTNSTNNHHDNKAILYRRRPPTYRWIGAPHSKLLSREDPTITKYNYRKLEIRVGNHCSFISVGDSVLLCSGDMEEDELYGGPLLPADEPQVTSNNNIPSHNHPTKAKELKSKTDQKNKNKNNNSLKQYTKITNGETKKNKANTTDENESILGLVAGDIAINALDPFVAKIDSMWEEWPTSNSEDKNNDKNDDNGVDNFSSPTTTHKNSKKQKSGNSESEPQMIYHDESRTRMKFRARWYFKKEDVEGLKGNFLGVSRERVLATMTHRDIILGNQYDVNEVATILGKCLVLRRKPNDKKEEDENLPKGAFISQYNLEIRQVNQKSNSSGAVSIIPYEGEDEVDPRAANQSVENDEDPIEFKKDPEEKVETDGGVVVIKNNDSKTSSNQQPLPPTLVIPADTNLSSLEDYDEKRSDEKCIENVSLLSEDVGSDVSSFVEKEQERTTQNPTTEGSVTHGKIHVGEQYQAVLPPAITKKGDYRPSRQTNPTIVWKPNNKLTESEINSYLLEVAKSLRLFIKNRGIEPTSSNFMEGSTKQNKSDTTTSKDTIAIPDKIDKEHSLKIFHRECELDKIISILNEYNYDTKRAIEAIEASPNDYITFWNKQEQELFNAGFRRYCGSLRMITRGVGPTKNHKDVVDYHYRFKIPSQFLRYQEKKRDQAKRMLEFVDKKLFEEVLSKNEGGSGGSNTKSNQGGVTGNSVSSKKIRSWSISGGNGTEMIGATEKRRVLAKDYLAYTRDTIGPDKYNDLALYLKLYHAKKMDMTLLKRKIGDVLENFPSLHSKFLEFLPKKLRS